MRQSSLFLHFLRMLKLRMMSVLVHLHAYIPQVVSNYRSPVLLNALVQVAA